MCWAPHGLLSVPQSGSLFEGLESGEAVQQLLTFSSHKFTLDGECGGGLGVIGVELFRGVDETSSPTSSNFLHLRFLNVFAFFLNSQLFKKQE